ncbi:NADH-quinone oxidoreductase subunit C [Streptomyces sp. NPDC088794]|uniref:NADH-quinone oxidoreductase subunit C n=1 Tax=Streptomyces sp. NPDC088794 TaxID=3365902 RepID=UPI0037FF0BAC
MTTIGWLPAPAEELFGTEATAEESYEVLTVDVPPTTWLTALRVARDELGCTYFDWLSAVDEPGTGFRVSAHVVALAPVRRLLVRTTVPHESPTLASAVDVYAGAAWHERETHEMFGVVFDGHPALDHLLLPETFEGHPLRKDFVLAARVAKAWPGAKEPGESDHGGPKRRQTLPPGVPDPNEWGPQKGQLPPAPARPARAAGRAPGRAAVERPAGATADRPARATGDRPPRRTRTAGDGSAGQTGSGPAEGPSTPATEGASAGATPAVGTPGETPTPGSAPASPSSPRRNRTASEGSASQTAPGVEATGNAPAGPRRSRSASQGSASQQPATTPEPEPSSDNQSKGEDKGQDKDRGEAAAPPKARTAPRSSDAPWHHARPAFDAPESGPEPASEATSEPTSESAESVPAAGQASNPEAPQNPDAPEDSGRNPGATPQAQAPEDPAGGPQ